MGKPLAGEVVVLPFPRTNLARWDRAAKTSHCTRRVQSRTSQSVRAS